MRGSSPRGRGKRVNERSAPNRPGLIPAWAGKTDTPTRLAAHVPGSSPRGRGKRVEGGGRQRCQRLIPAWAGKTRGYGRADRGLTAHPRVGGENVTQLAPGELSNGSSPRGRGKLLVGVGGRLRPRLIPAWAGKTMTAIEARACSGAHPRVGGENVGGPLAVFGVPGSSPRGRGKRERSGLLARPGGLIPAWAGKTPAGSRSGSACRAHPRVGGENPARPASTTARQGSSPRGRGKPADSPEAPEAPGLIPAWAGKTMTRPRFLRGAAAHPRVGGENLGEQTYNAIKAGSSPRGRGKPSSRSPRRTRSGLIPAWAGKTAPRSTCQAASSAHPRVGGENFDRAMTRSSAPGSSPRGRGKHFLTCAFIKRIGQILETLELAVSSGSYSLCDVYATDAQQDQARNTGLALPSSRAAS